MIIVGVVLIIFSLMDIKVRAIPSILLTGMLFVVAFINVANLWFGIMGFMMAYLLYESGFFGGVADIKVMALLSFMVNTTNWLLLLILLTCIYGFCWITFVKIRVRDKDNETAFVPVFLFVYGTLLFLGGIS
jgi:Flp pilus assembly protein protease CpaA